MDSNGVVSPKVKITKDGPYVVSGNVPMSKMVIEVDSEGTPIRWRETEKYPHRKTYSLCRCGGSTNMPYCDGDHKENGFDGTETAGYHDYLYNVEIWDGPELKLTDNKPLCTDAGFCTRVGGIWDLTMESDDPEKKRIAIQEAADYPSYRLVVWDKKGNPIEPEFEPSIVITEDQYGVPGPIWVRGNILIESEEGKTYEVRNRVTLCQCGHSKNKPFCDGCHRDKERP